MVVGKVFVRPDHVDKAEHPVEEMLPDVTNHQISPRFRERDRLLPIGTIEGIGGRWRAERPTLRVDPEVKDFFRWSFCRVEDKCTGSRNNIFRLRPWLVHDYHTIWKPLTKKCTTPS